jgi:cytochrome oxidase assembly protein ShyY1
VTYPDGVLRGFFTPRSLGLFALLLLVVAATTLLGFWQLGVAQNEGRKEAVAAAARLERQPLDEVTKPHAPFAAEFSNRPVTATGTYVAQDQILVVDRRLDGRVGTWVVAPLRLESGGTVAVLRGFVDGRPSTAPTAPSGLVTVAGTLGPSESPRSGTTPLPEPQRHSIDLSALVNEWPGDLYNAVLIASAETAGPEASTTAQPVDASPLTRVPPPRLDGDLILKNAAYAVQWWVFGLFAIWMWWKIKRAERETGTALDELPDGPQPEPDGDRPDAAPQASPRHRPHEEETRV